MGLDMYIKKIEPFQDIEFGSVSEDSYRKEVILNNPMRANKTLSTLVKPIPAHYVDKFKMVDGTKYSIWEVVDIKGNDITIMVWDDEQGGTKEVVLNKLSITEVTWTCAYWRKVNQVHRWFVENVQNNQDDCGTYLVSVEQLKELLKVCKEVLEAHSDALSSTLLPTQSGCFFGSTSYDDWYYSDIQDTIDQLEPLVRCPNAIYYYHSSW